MPGPACNVHALGKVWVAVSENSTLLCCLIDDGKKSIWDYTDDEAETVGATGAQAPCESMKEGTLPGVTQSATEEQASSSNWPAQQESAEVKDEKEDVKSMEASEVIAELGKTDAELAEQMEEIEAVEEAQDAAMLQKPDFVKTIRCRRRSWTIFIRSFTSRKKRPSNIWIFLPKLQNQRLFRRDV